jgi:hypothetical protein
VQFLDAHLLSASNEKRGVALHITTLLVQRVPADCLPLALSAVSSFFSGPFLCCVLLNYPDFVESVSFL